MSSGEYIKTILRTSEPQYRSKKQAGYDVAKYASIQIFDVSAVWYCMSHIDCTHVLPRSTCSGAWLVAATGLVDMIFGWSCVGCTCTVVVSSPSLLYWTVADSGRGRGWPWSPSRLSAVQNSIVTCA